MRRGYTGGKGECRLAEAVCQLEVCTRCTACKQACVAERATGEATFGQAPCARKLEVATVVLHCVHTSTTSVQLNITNPRGGVKTITKTTN